MSICSVTEKNHRTHVKWLAFTCVALLGFLPGTGYGQGSNHDLTLLHQTGDVVDGITLSNNFMTRPTINEAGDVLWNSRAYGEPHLFLNNSLQLGPSQPMAVGGTKYVIPWGSGGVLGNFDNEGNWIVIASDQGGGEALITSSGEVLAQRPGSMHGRPLRNFSLGFVGVDVNAAGDRVIGAAFETGDDREQFLSLNGELLVQTGDMVDGRTLRGDDWPYGPIYPTINDRGDLLYFAATEEGPSFFLNDRVLYEVGQQIGDFVVQNISFLRRDLNNNGDLAWIAQLADPEGAPEGFSALMINDQIIVREGEVFGGEQIADFGGVSLNDHGQFLFIAGLVEGGVAVFSNLGLVAKPGDTIDEYTMPPTPSFGITPDSLNNAGEFVFSMRRDVENQYLHPAGLFRGRIRVPEPSSVVMAALTGTYLVACRRMRSESRYSSSQQSNS